MLLAGQETRVVAAGVGAWRGEVTKEVRVWYDICENAKYKENSFEEKNYPSVNLFCFCSRTRTYAPKLYGNAGSDCSTNRVKRMKAIIVAAIVNPVTNSFCYCICTSVLSLK